MRRSEGEKIRRLEGLKIRKQRTEGRDQTRKKIRRFED